MKTEDIKKALRKKTKQRKLTSKDFLSTGSTLLNCAITGDPNNGFAKGHYYFIVGDSVSGKTWLSLTCLAEAALSPHFKNYRFIYDNAEDGALMNIEKFFGKEVARRMQPPNWLKDAPLFSATIEEFYYNVDTALRNALDVHGTPFIYILDSMDSLSSEPETEKFDANKKAYEKGKEAKGSYGDGKAKINSSNIRRLLSPLKKSGSILIILNQTRDNIGAMPFQPKKTRSGGHALKFYACVELWSSTVEKIKKTIRGKKRQLGIRCKIQIKKNRITGRERSVEIPIYHSFGIDDVGSCIDYLLEEEHWKKSNAIINAKDFDFKGSRRKLIKHIEKENLEKDLRELVSDVWNEIEEACQIERKPRYE